MSLFAKMIFRVPTALHQVAKYSVSITNTTDTFPFKSNFTREEQEKILNTLNGSNPDQLSRFSVSQNRIKNLITWKNKKGPFRTLNDVLEVEGLGVKVLEKICQKIITNTELHEMDEVQTIKVNNMIYKRFKQLVTPPLPGNIVKNLQSAVGIHLGPMGISWAKLSCDQNKLTEWSYEDFSMLPKKMLPAENFDLAFKIINKLPTADVYILEANSTISPQSTIQSASVSSYTQQLEFSSMLIALINTSVRHNIWLQKEVDNGIEPKKIIENRVFHLRSKIPARLFKTLVGTEKVAALRVVTELVESNLKLNNFSLPCTRISLEQQLKDAFIIQTSANKELLGQALILVISFMDLCIYKNPVSLAALSSNKKNL